jgi:hypothetical protein
LECIGAGKGSIEVILNSIQRRSAALAESSPYPRPGHFAGEILKSTWLSRRSQSPLEVKLGESAGRKWEKKRRAAALAKSHRRGYQGGRVHAGAAVGGGWRRLARERISLSETQRLPNRSETILMAG